MPVYMKPSSVIVKNLGIGRNGPVSIYFTKLCADTMDKYVPYDSGILSDYRIEGNYIIYNQQYAQYQYHGMRRDGSHVINEANRNRDMHELATSYWDRAMVTAEIDDIVEAVQEKINTHH